MTDIVWRLREFAPKAAGFNELLANDAANEIAQLRALLKQVNDTVGRCCNCISLAGDTTLQARVNAAVAGGTMTDAAAAYLRRRVQRFQSAAREAETDEVRDHYTCCASAIEDEAEAIAAGAHLAQVGRHPEGGDS